MQLGRGDTSAHHPRAGYSVGVPALGPHGCLTSAPAGEALLQGLSWGRGLSECMQPGVTLQPPDAQCTRMHSGLLHLNPHHRAVRLLCQLVSCAFPVPPPQSQLFSGPHSAPGAVNSTLPAFSHLTFLRLAHPASLLYAQRNVV